MTRTNQTCEKSPPRVKEEAANLLILTPPIDTSKDHLSSPSSSSSSYESPSTSETTGSTEKSVILNNEPETENLLDNEAGEENELDASANEDEEEPQVTLIGAGLKSVTFNLPAKEAQLEERERKAAELEAQLDERQLELEKKEQEFEKKADEWVKQYENKKQELIELETRVQNLQQQQTKSEEGHKRIPSDVGDQQTSDNYHRKSMSRPCTINENEVINASELDDFDIKTPPRSFSRPSIGQWSVERRKNNMSVKSMINNFEKR